MAEAYADGMETPETLTIHSLNDIPESITRRAIGRNRRGATIVTLTLDTHNATAFLSDGRTISYPRTNRHFGGMCTPLRVVEVDGSVHCTVG